MAHIYNLKIERIPQEQLLFKATPGLATLTTVDLRPKLPPVYDQGQLGSCTANALVAAFQYEKPSFMGSRLFLYYNERLLMGSVHYDSGATLADGIKCLKTYGVCAEKEWPYVISAFTKKPPAQCYKNALLNRAVTVTNIIQTGAGMRASINAGFPFVVGFMVYASFESPQVNATGIIPMPSPRERMLGGHAVLICGYNDKKQWWIARNSWGTSWGDKGYFYLPYAYLLNRNLASDLWNITGITGQPTKVTKITPSMSGVRLRI